MWTYEAWRLQLPTEFPIEASARSPGFNNRVEARYHQPGCWLYPIVGLLFCLTVHFHCRIRQVGILTLKFLVFEALLICNLSFRHRDDAIESKKKPQIQNKHQKKKP